MLVQQYNLSHGLKERIVDTLVFLIFGDALPKYKVQNMGDTEFDEYLNSPDGLARLGIIVEEYLAGHK